MWGIIPAAGKGSRIQPLAFSKELLPMGTYEGEVRRPRAVSDFLMERFTITMARRNSAAWSRWPSRAERCITT